MTTTSSSPARRSPDAARPPLTGVEVVGGGPSGGGSRRYRHTDPFELAVDPSRDGGGRKPGDVVQETGGGTVTETTSPLPARVPARRVAGRVAHEPSVPARVLPGRTAGNARAGAPRARPAQKSRADALLPRTDRHDACPRLGPRRPNASPSFARTRAHARAREERPTPTVPTLALIMTPGPGRGHPHESSRDRTTAALPSTVVPQVLPRGVGIDVVRVRLLHEGRS